MAMIKAERDATQIELESIDRQMKNAAAFLDGMTGVVEWLKGPLQLEPNQAVRLHKLREAARSGQLRARDGNDDPTGPLLLENAESFVVEHDWATAFASAQDFAVGDWRMPFPICAFEFKLSGRTLIMVVLEHEGCCRKGWGFAQVDDTRWYMLGALEGTAVWDQIRAICIALDANVATHEVVRAPEKLNRKRERAGKLPFSDYHVVRLHERYQRRKFDGGGTHRSPRLHFRRGHWRHYDTHKTWIRWTLCGDPHLGFIDKDYRL